MEGSAFFIQRLPYVSCLILLSIIGLLYVAYRSALPKPIPGIPYDTDGIKRFFGSVPAILRFGEEHGQRWPWFYGQTAKHNSPLVQIWMGPFSKPTLILSDYQEAQDIQLRRNREFDRSRWVSEVFKTALPQHHVTMSTSDPRFRRNKDLVRDLMAPGFLEEVSATEIYSKTRLLVDLWTLKIGLVGGSPFNASRDIFGVAIDIINAATFAFDDSMSTVKHQLDYLNSMTSVQVTPDLAGAVEFPFAAEIPDIAALRAVTRHVDNVSSSVAPGLAHHLSLLTSGELRANIRRKNDLIHGQIAKALGRLKAGERAMFSATDHVVQRELSAAEKADRKPNFRAEHLRDELFGYIVAGHDTSATSLCWITKLIAQHQEIQHKLRSALRTAYTAARTESRQPTVTEIIKTSIPYLDAVMEEALRFAPAVPAIIRIATVDTTVLGYRVPKGTDIFMVNEGPGYKAPAISVDDGLRSETSRTKHRGGQWNPDDMHLFRPERWLVHTGEGKVEFDGHAGPILAFGLGPRGCFGRRLAYLEIRLVLALLVWNFQFKELGGVLASNQTHEGITTTPKYCYVALEKLD